ncbi:unnamed protein product [Darwinula stevensoni]|uniref:LRRCT domain-containing protein n=1 Tax=Darwinula stevensoni TaxID=69355 RepID=A0A7R8X9G9_9CRUS|nr:unnamed protein product [Darwinula stevensoni]CAG0884532.1 unnamed protein product [Darwinula stevensoni]
MIKFLLVVCLIGFVVSQNDTIYDEGTICKLCSCDKDVNPVRIVCTNVNFNRVWTQATWESGGELELIMDQNEIPVIEPWAKLPIVSLSMRYCKVQKIQPKAFQNLVSLRRLDLSHNSLSMDGFNRESFIGPDSLLSGLMGWDLLPLELVDLSHNHLHAIDKDAFEHLDTVKELRLDYNPLRNIDHQTAIAVTSIHNLETLNLAATELKSLPHAFFDGFQNLKTVILAENQFTKIPEELSSCRELHNLNMNMNPITSLNAGEFKGLESLVTLNMSKMLDLRFLYLNGNDIKFLPKNLVEWDKLKVLDIQKNPYRCDCRNAWMKGLIEMLMKKDMSRTFDITCGSPDDVKKRDLDFYYNDKDMETPCNIPDDGRLDHHQQRVVDAKSSGGAVVALVIIALLIIILSSAGMIYFMYSKKRPYTNSYTSGHHVKYTRAEEDEGIEKAPVSL